MDVPQQPAPRRQRHRLDARRRVGHRHLPWSGPLGESPRVDDLVVRPGGCAGFAVDSRDRLVGLCGDLHGPTLHVIDPDSMNPVATKELRRREHRAARTTLCAGRTSTSTTGTGPSSTTTDRRVLVVATSDADGDPDLTTERELRPRRAGARRRLPGRAAAGPGGAHLVGHAAGPGRHLDPASGAVRVLDLGEEVAELLRRRRDGAYVVTTDALYRLQPRRLRAPDGDLADVVRPGQREKSGQLSRAAAPRRPCCPAAWSRSPTTPTRGWTWCSTGPTAATGLPLGRLRGRRERHRELPGLGRHRA